VLRMARYAGRNGIRNKGERIGTARVLGVRHVIEIHFARVGIEHDVLEDRSEAPRGVPNLWLGLLRQFDHLGVAAALEVEDAAVTPTVLVVTDQPAVRIAGERRFPGAGQTKEE